MGKVCGVKGCPELVVKRGRCAVHARPAWNGTVKNHGFKSGWEWTRIKTKQLQEYPYCQVNGCGLLADEVHQPVKGSSAGLLSLCKVHHGEITQRQAAAARKGNVKDW